MNGSGCKNCPVSPCLTLYYRGSYCFEQRAKHGLGDPMTNADRIRAMSDEELRELFMFDTPFEMIVNSGNCLGSPCNCRECILIWLQQPAEPPKEDT